MSVSTEEQRILSLFERVEVIEEVASTLPEDDARRAKLLAVSRDALAEEGSVRPVIAAKVLGLSEKTVRAWASPAFCRLGSDRHGCCLTCPVCMRSATSSAQYAPRA